jgi:LPXTG-site transpeptidase (sortase) family protein
MNDIEKKENIKESNFKVYKDKLSSMIPNFGSKKNQDSNPQKTIPQENSTIPTINKNNNTLEDIRNKIKSQAIKRPSSPSTDKTPTLQQSNTTSAPKSSKTKNDLILLILKTLIIVIISLILGYIVVNFQALFLRFNYWYTTSIKNEKWTDLHPVILQKAQSTAQKLDENYLYIPTLGIQAPIHWGIDQSDVSSMLSSGLVHYYASSVPDDAYGNIYITGNTSGPIWSSNQYKNIFTNLDKAEIDQVITIIYKNNIYSYRIIEIKYLNSSQVIISPGETTNSELNLLARYPIGINFKTLLVKAELFKIESNIVKSIQDKIDNLQEIYDSRNPHQLGPIEVAPSTPKPSLPTEDKTTNPELLPQHFLPDV